MGVVRNISELILPWLIFAWAQFAYYSALFVYALVKEGPDSAVEVAVYMVMICIAYYLNWLYYRQLKSNVRNKHQVAV